MKLHRDDKIAVYQEKLNSTEQTIYGKIKLVHTKLHNMKARLTTSSADIELSVNIERTTFKALEYRKFIAAKEEEKKQYNDDLHKQSEILQRIEGIMDAIQKEMQAAIESDEMEMWSELVHETPQVVEIEELKTRLKSRAKQEFDEYNIQKEQEKKILIKVKNVES
jgi:hypothetical protein